VSRHVAAIDRPVIRSEVAPVPSGEGRERRGGAGGSPRPLTRPSPLAA